MGNEPVPKRDVNRHVTMDVALNYFTGKAQPHRSESQAQHGHVKSTNGSMRKNKKRKLADKARRRNR